MSTALPVILVVEDDPGHLLIVKRRLSETWRVVGARSMAEARARLAEVTPELILTDLALHDGEGTELVRPANDPGAAPVVVMTSQGNEAVAVETMRSGVLDYVVKGTLTFERLPDTLSRVRSEWERRVSAARDAQALRDREARLSAILRATPAGIGLVSDRVLLEVNDYLCHMVGRSREELVGQSARLLYPTEADYRFVCDEKYRQIGERGTGSVETRWLHADGRILDVLLSSTPLDPETPTQNVVFTAVDITERETAHRALQQSQRRWETTFNAMSDWVCLLDTDSRIIRSNPAGAAFLGRPLEELTGRICCEVVRGTPHPMPGCPMRKAFETGERQRLELQLPQDGRWVVVIADPVKDETGRVTGGVHVLRDITKQKEAAEAVRQYALRLEELSRELIKVQERERQHLAQELHDEFGQTMTVLRLQLQRLKERLPPEFGDEVAGCLETADGALDQVRVLSHDLRPALLEDLGLGAALTRYLEERLGHTDLDVELHLDPPDLKCDPVVGSTCYRLVQEATTNCLRHAKASRLCIRATEGEGLLTLDLEDDGLGFEVDAALQQSIRGQSMGLSGMHQRVMLVGGALTIESTPGKGTRIHVEVPQTASPTRRLAAPSDGREDNAQEG